MRVERDTKRSLTPVVNTSVETKKSELRELFVRRDFAALKTMLHRSKPTQLRDAWPVLEPMQKAAMFKLMEPAPALEFFRALPFAEKYFLLGAFDMGAIAPLLEDLPMRTRSLFRRLPEGSYDELVRSLNDGAKIKC